MAKKSFRSRLNYEFDNFMSTGPTRLVFYLLLSSVVLVSIYAIFLYFISVHPDTIEGLNYTDTFWTSLMHILDPGNLGEQDGNAQYRIAMLLLTIFGIIVVSTLIGLISNGIMDTLDDLRKGRSLVVEQDHVLILGWSTKIFTIISELVLANENQKDPCIVVLAPMDKITMEDQIRDKVGNSKNTRIVCRTGNPIDIHDLKIGNPAGSKSIVILDKDSENSDSQVIKIIVAIISSPQRRRRPYHITAEIERRRNYEVAKMVGKEEVELILSNDFVSKVMVQTSRQSGLSVVYTELMDFGGDEIYFMEEPSLVGKTFREAIFSYEDSAIIGVFSAKDGTVEVNPPMGRLIQQGDQLIGITEDDDTMIVSSGVDFNIDEAKIRLTNEAEAKPESTLLIGWNHRAKKVIREIDFYAAPGSHIKVVSKFDATEAIRDLQARVSNVRLEFQQDDTTDRTVLEELECTKYDYILLLCYQEHFPLQEADAQTLITLLHLRNILALADKKINVVSEMMDLRNRMLADVTSADDFIVSDKLLSLLMTQVTENKYLMRVFEDLLDAEGSEIYIKPVSEYVSLDGPVNFYTVLESAARKNEVAIGYRRMFEAKSPERGYGVVVNPKKSDLIYFEEKDKVIVLSES